MTIQTLTREQTLEDVATQPIRVLVERYPHLMPVLARYGMDLCCGGGHTVAEAARLHGLDVGALNYEVAAVILAERG
jgi:iron-sulfur cluster repair protein YtfE (RIC family)